jgi:hypothetical protein
VSQGSKFSPLQRRDSPRQAWNPGRLQNNGTCALTFRSIDFPVRPAHARSPRKAP